MRVVHESSRPLPLGVWMSLRNGMRRSTLSHDLTAWSIEIGMPFPPRVRARLRDGIYAEILRLDRRMGRAA